MSDPESLDIESWLIAGGRPNQPGAPLNVPIVTASNFEHGGKMVYSREDGTETVLALEQLLGGMEGGQAIAFGSGMAAAAAVFHDLATGANLAIPDDCYHGVAALAAHGANLRDWKIERIAPEDTAAWQNAAASADLVWLESPSNPLLGVADLPAICGAPRKEGNLICVDSTFATPLLQRPLASGADIVMHSTTKFIGGHSDLLGGALITKSSTVAAKLIETRTHTGGVPGALESFLTIRGCRTLGVRMERAQASAAVLAARLQEHADIDVVRYPGLETHATHEIAKRTLDGFGAMVTFDLSGDGECADRFCHSLRLIQNATSLGGVESTLERRSNIEGQEHLPPALLRFSVGCEAVDDLWSDIEQAIAASR